MTIGTKLDVWPAATGTSNKSSRLNCAALTTAAKLSTFGSVVPLIHFWIVE